jgi:hypothetical protein
MRARSTAIALVATAALVGGAVTALAGSAQQTQNGGGATQVLDAVTHAFRTMTRTRYQHHYVEHPRRGVYLFDCVGMADYFLHRGAPQAWQQMHTALGIRRGYVPRPTRWADYLRGDPADWQRVNETAAIRPGDFILMDKSTTTRFVGHALIAAGTPHRRADGTYSLVVYDATGTAHGPRDSRLHDRRAEKRDPWRRSGSGLGRGTIQITPDGTGAPAAISWSVGARPIQTGVVVSRPRG